MMDIVEHVHILVHTFEPTHIGVLQRLLLSNFSPSHRSKIYCDGNLSVWIVMII